MFQSGLLRGIVRNQTCPLRLLGGPSGDRIWVTSKEAREFKIETELSGDMQTAFLM